MENTNYQFSGFTHCNAQLTKPAPIGVSDLSFKPLTLMCGTNGSGKSLFNKLTWVANMFINTAITFRQLTNVERSEEEHINELQFILDGTLTDNDLTGYMIFQTVEEAVGIEFVRLSFEVEEGKVQSVGVDFPLGCQPSGTPIYASKETRTFEALDRYITLKDIMGIEEFKSNDDFAKLLKMHRLYDIITMETVITKLKACASFDNALYKTFLETANLGDAKSFEIDVNGVYFRTDKERVKCSTLSAGEQSMLMLVLYTL